MIRGKHFMSKMMQRGFSKFEDTQFKEIKNKNLHLPHYTILQPNTRPARGEKIKPSLPIMNYKLQFRFLLLQKTVHLLLLGGGKHQSTR